MIYRELVRISLHFAVLNTTETFDFCAHTIFRKIEILYFDASYFYVWSPDSSTSNVNI